VSTLSDRLREIVRGPAQAGPCERGVARGVDRDVVPRANPIDLENCLEGQWFGHCFIVERRFPATRKYGRATLGDLAERLRASAADAPLICGRASAAPPFVFFDLETTGLSGGAGTQAFLVGCARFDGATFRIRQFVLTTFAAERALLDALCELAEEAGTVVTYNGKTFDLPLIETRFVMNRMDTPFAGMPHLDMLHPARRLWRGRDEVAESEGCRLATLERVLCDVSRVGDVPGMEIPARYFRFLRSGDARPLEPVLEHNRLDIVSLAMLTARAAQLLEDGPSAAITGREALGLGRLYERAGLMADALAAYRRASDAGAGTLRVEALRASAIMLRRLRRYEEAAATWRDLLTAAECSSAYAREASEALAVHHEHRARDLEAARSFAVQSLSLQGTPARQQATRHRLARLDRKLGHTPLPLPAALF